MLLHISDIHARPGQNLVALADSVAAAIAPYGQPTHLVASGDFGFQGQHAALGARFARLQAERLSLSPSRVVCCPGNHDIELSDGRTSLQTYHREIAGLLQDAGRADPTAASIYSNEGIDFLVLNSAHLLEWSHGHVDLSAIQRLNLRSRTGTGVAVVHHHCIPFDESDPSHISNAHPLLNLLEANGFHALLHGHRHMSMTLRLNTLRIVGVGSVNYPPVPNINNQFNLIEVGKYLLRFRFIGDVQSKHGIQGSWVGEKEDW
jgi:3',5'-cyclic AMP phosphodiesterase CpdA